MGSMGNMNRKVSFQVPTKTRTAMGAPQNGFAHSYYAWVSREQVGAGNELYINDRLVSPYGFKYHTHYRNRGCINETMRIVDDSETFNILSINPDDMKMFIDIYVDKVIE